MPETMTPETNGWSKAELHVMAELERLSGKMDAMDEKVTGLRIEVAQKGAIWGAVSATAVSLVAWVLKR